MSAAEEGLRVQQPDDDARADAAPPGAPARAGLLGGLVTWKLVKFLALGAFSYGFAVAQMALYVELLAIPAKPAYALTLVVLIAVNYLVNRYWIFSSTEENPLTQGGKYVLAVLAGRFADWALFALLDTFVPILPYWGAVFVSMGIVLPAKFLVFKRLVFRDRG